MSGELAIALAAALILAAVAAAVIAVRTRRVVATPTERAVHAALHTASLAARALRRGLDTESAQTAAPFLRGLTGTDGVALFDGDGRLLAQDPPDESICRTRCVPAGRARIDIRPAPGADARPDIASHRPTAAGRGRRRARCAGRGDDALARPRHARRGRRGRPLRGQPDRIGRTGRLARPPRPRRGTCAACPDQPALHLQRAEHHRVVRAHRPRPGPRADPRIRRLHPLFVPRRGPVHDAGRGAAQHRSLPQPRTGPVRHRTEGQTPSRPGGPQCRRAVPGAATVGGERRPARVRRPE